jgi:serine/threonine-protein kinase
MAQSEGLAESRVRITPQRLMASHDTTASQYNPMPNMKPERWNHVDRLLDAALELPPDKRAAFLDKACAGDEELRKELDLLLASDDGAQSFLEKPALEVAAKAMADNKDSISGQTLGHYKIISRVGAGGMGEVYLAQDTKLDRKVALKTMPPGLAGDRNRMHRFVLEAKAASALNHPNILTIYEIGDIEGQPFIVTEFIDGMTLRERLGSPLDTEEALDIAIQISSTLAAAQKIHIIHRDIKPENIMIRKDDGLVKVLDFGLAKMIQGTQPVDSAVDTALKVNTGPGVVIGTLAYMSPEQARGETVDERTDIWSLGVVLYEMIAGCSPFVAATSNEIISAILSKQAVPPLTRYARIVPERLEEIVEKSLAKNKEERYQTSKDLLIDLKRLQQTLQLKSASERSNSPEKFEVPTSSESDKPKFVEQGTSPTQPASNAEYIVNQVRSHKRAALTSLAVVLLIAAGVFYFWRIRQTAAPAEPAIKALAVLPFLNQTGSPESEYLSDGITESLIGRLSQIPNLSVKARSSVFRFKGKDIAVKDIGKELNVPAVLTGRVARHENEVSLYIELVDAATENVMWRAEYNRPESSLPTIASEIARDVANNIRRKLTGAEEQIVTRNYTENSDAYELYLKGRYYWDKRNEESYKIAEDAYKQAIALDPNYALAYAGLADLYLFREASIGRKTAMPKAKSFALKALELDETLAEAHTTLAFINENYDFDMPAAEAGFKRAIELKSNHAIAHQFYGGFLIQTGHIDEGLAEVRRALELEPYSAAINWHYGLMLNFAQRYDEAIAQQQKTLQLQPNYRLAEGALAGAYINAGRLADAATLTQKGIQDDNNQGAWLAMARIRVLSGNREDGKKILARVLNENSGDKINSYGVAGVYAALGDKDKTIEWLNRGYEQRVFPMFFLRVDPVFDSVRDHPRFQELVRRIGLSA